MSHFKYCIKPHLKMINACDEEEKKRKTYQSVNLVLLGTPTRTMINSQLTDISSQLATDKLAYLDIDDLLSLNDKIF